MAGGGTWRLGLLRGVCRCVPLYESLGKTLGGDAGYWVVLAIWGTCLGKRGIVCRPTPTLQAIGGGGRQGQAHACIRVFASALGSAWERRSTEPPQRLCLFTPQERVPGGALHSVDTQCTAAATEATMRCEPRLAFCPPGMGGVGTTTSMGYEYGLLVWAMGWWWSIGFSLWALWVVGPWWREGNSARLGETE